MMDITDNPPRVRFAPSPTGNLHIGSARTALFNWLFAKKNRGTFILRIEDTDVERSTKEFEEKILEDLNWLGLDFDEGPSKGEFGPYHQSARLDIYRQKAEELVNEEKAYYCYCSVEELQMEKKKALIEGLPSRYSGRCQKLTAKEKQQLEAEGRKAAIRFAVGEGELAVEDMIYDKVHFNLDEISDFIILRPDGSPTFHLAVVVDDILMQISHVIRGEDHLSNTPKHILLFNALGYKVPKFAHLPIILGSDRAKLSKRHGATAIFDYRDGGYLSKALFNYLAFLSFRPPGEEEVYDPDELVESFDLSRVSKNNPIFDLDKLKWLNGQHIRKLADNDLAELINPYLKDAGMNTGEERLNLIAGAIKENLVTLNEAADYAEVFFQDEVSYSKDIQDYLKEEACQKAISSFQKLYAEKTPQNFDQAKDLIHEHSATLKPLGIKGKNAFMPIRLALTGSYSGPELFYLITILEQAKVTNRLQRAEG